MMYFQSLTRAELAELLLPLGRAKLRRSELEDQMKAGLSEADAQKAIDEKLAKKARYRAKQVFHWVYQRHVRDWDLMTDLSKDLRGWLKENVEIYVPQEAQSRQALDGTMKFLWQLRDAKTIESVIIPAALQQQDTEQEESEESEAGNERAAGDTAPRQRLTLCISSQVGCAMGCKFCLTGIQGLDRHLDVHEIVGQVLELRMRAPISNIVFMGMGEPLHNIDAVSKACQILLDEDGLNFSKRKITVSTSGVVSGIDELGKRTDVSLAISLNATTDEQRSQIMPVNKKWNIQALLDACRRFPLGSHRRITFEYVLLKDFNDSLEDAARLVRLVRGIPSKINLIPFNEHPGSDYKRPSDETVTAFQKYLMARGLTALIRISKGRDILAACGQLRSVFGTARGTERHRDYPAK